METIALLDLKVVQRAYEQDEQGARACFKKLYDHSVALLFMSDDPRSPQTKQWFEDKGLDKHNYAYKEDAIKRPYFFLKPLLPDWKQEFVRSYLEGMDQGNILPKMDYIYVVLGDEKVRQGVAAINDSRVKIYKSLEDLVNEIGTPQVKIFSSPKDLIEEMERLKREP